MAESRSRLPEQFQPGGTGRDYVPDDFNVHEIAADIAGAMSPFGPELEFPLAPERLRYEHPSAADRPHLADGA